MTNIFDRTLADLAISGDQLDLKEGDMIEWHTGGMLKAFGQVLEIDRAWAS